MSNEKINQALIKAVMNGNIELAENLITKHNVDVNAPDMFGNTPLIMLAGMRDDEDMAKLLLKHGAKIRMDDGSFKPLALADYYGNWKVAKAIVEHAIKSPSDATSTTTFTVPPEWAGKNGKLDTEKFMKAGGADACTNDNPSNGMLLRAAVLGGLDLAKESLREDVQTNKDKAYINTMSKKDGNTPLMLSAMFSNLEIVEFLLENRADITLRNNRDKDTALMLAAKYDHWDVAKVLVEYAIRLDDEAEAAAKC